MIGNLSKLKNKKTILLAAALIVSIVGYNFWLIAWHNFFYQCNAIFLLLIFLLLKSIKVKEKHFNKIATIGFWLCLNNLIDEIFFDPTKYGWNEYAIFIIIIFITFRPNNKIHDGTKTI